MIGRVCLCVDAPLVDALRDAPCMSVVKINAVTVPEGMGDDFMERFAPHLTKQKVDEAVAHQGSRSEIQELFKDIELPTY